MQSSVSFTLPISCQICLGKVKEPVTCSNQHVFCSSCMNVWLERNSRCPTCRVEITSKSPLRKIIGGVLPKQDEADQSRNTSRELRRARFELILKEHEDEILRLENEVDRLQKDNHKLKKRVESARSHDSSAASCSSDSLDKFSFDSRPSNSKDLDVMLDLSKRLQEATDTYTGMKVELTEAKKINEDLLKNNDDLIRENKRIRQECDTRSPVKYGRLTVATLEARLQAALKENDQLKKAMQRNDSYIEELETKLRCCENSVSGSQAELQFHNSLDLTSSDPMDDPLTQACDIADIFNDDQKNQLSTLPIIEGSCPAYDETSKASSFFELHGFDSNFTPPASSESTDVLYCSSRKLEFDHNPCDFLSNSQDSNSSFRSVDGSNSSKQQNSYVSNTPMDLPSSSPLLNDRNDKGPWLQPSPATKTVIKAGGSRITMSQLSAEDQNRFSRPSSAPSRTFLLSGSRFSALRPLDSPKTDSGFQPVKCISPMDSIAGSSTESDKGPSSPTLRTIAPDDIIDVKYKKNEGFRCDDDLRVKDALSRVNILKRKSISKGTSLLASHVTTSPLAENRRKQKLYQKRGVDATFQSPHKSSKMDMR